MLKLSVRKGNKEIFGQHKNIKIFTEQEGKWDRAKGLEIAENLLQTVSFLDNRNTVTRFLTNFEQIVLSKVASYNYPDYKVEFFGGYEGSEKKKSKNNF